MGITGVSVEFVRDLWRSRRDTLSLRQICDGFTIYLCFGECYCLLPGIFTSTWRWMAKRCMFKGEGAFWCPVVLDPWERAAESTV